MRPRIISKAITCVLLFGRIAWSQLPAAVDPGAVEQHSTDASDYYKLENRIDGARKQVPGDPLTNRLHATPAASAKSTDKFLLKQVQFDASQILTPDQLRAAVRPYEGKTVTLADLDTLVASLNQTYKGLGYITAIAALPPQKVVNGTVRIQLVEARFRQGDRQRRSPYPRFLLHEQNPDPVRRIASGPGCRAHSDRLQRTQ